MQNQFVVQVTAPRLKEMLIARVGRIEQMIADQRAFDAASTRLNDRAVVAQTMHQIHSLERKVESLRLLHDLVAASSEPVYSLTIDDLRALDLVRTSDY